MLLIFESERCPDGVELFDYGPERPLRRGQTIAGAPRSGRWFRYRTKRRERLHLESPNLENPVVVQYVNARTDEDRASFFSRFGLPTGQEIEPDEIAQGQRGFKALLAKAGSEDAVQGLEAVNATLAKYRSFYLQPVLRLGDGTPQMLLQPQTLVGFMLMEISAVLLNGARFTSCQHCGSAFLTGPMTWRRAHAVYCSDRCRVAAMRARNAKRK